MRSSDSVWLSAVLVVIALAFAYLDPFDSAEAPETPLALATSRSSATPNIATTPETDKTGSDSFSIAGMGIGTYSWQVELYYKKLGTQGNTTHYGASYIDETTGETRYMLSVTYDLVGRATSLRGSSLNYGSGLVTFQEDGTSSPDLGRPNRVEATKRTWGTSYTLCFDSLGLDVTMVNDKAVEYFVHQ